MTRGRKGRIMGPKNLAGQIARIGKEACTMAEAMKYGKEEFAVTLPAEKIAAELEPNRVELPQRTVAEHIRYALAHPVDSAPLDQLVHAGETVCIVISDVTRRWQSPETYLPILIEELEKAGIRDEDMLILSATGTHRRQTEEESLLSVLNAGEKAVPLTLSWHGGECRDLISGHSFPVENGFLSLDIPPRSGYLLL